MAYVDLTDYENSFLSLVCGLYLLLFFVYLVIFGVYIRHVSRLTLHINLKVLLMHIPIPGLINMFVQVIQRVQFFANIEKIRNPWHILICLSDTAAFANFYQLDVLIIERVVATIWVSKYEETGKKFPAFGYSLIVVQWLLSVSTFTAAHIENLYKYVACFIGAANVLIAVFVFFFLPRITRRIHDEFRPTYEVLRFSSWKASLTQRYQSCENLRVSFLIKVLIAVELSSVITQIGVHATVRSIQSYTFNWYIALHFSYFNLNLHSLALMLIVIQPYFSTVDSCRAVTKDVIPKESPEVVNKLYFDMYSKAWG